jgi:type IX secretion system PorP/SprF family membrane protein
MRKLFIQFTIMLILPLQGWGQELFPVYSQFRNNGMAINPAYTGSREVLSTSLFYRKQWAGIDASPSMQSFAGHMPLKNPKVALGLLVLNENELVLDRFQVYGHYAYRVEIGPGKLSLGLKAGLKSTRENTNELIVDDAGDPFFQASPENYLMPNFGIGFYYYTPRTFIGFSLPSLLTDDIKGASGYSYRFDSKALNYLFSAGILLGSEIKYKASAIVRYSGYTPAQFDLNNHVVLLNDRLWLGLGARFDQNLVGSALVSSFDFMVNDQFMLGYAYDYNLAGISKYFRGSHEVFMRYEFFYRVKAVNPRYF